ncbi:MAG: hypothetical protein V1837_05615 [Candidatus Woesearchaeota archaeon]
MNLKAFVAIPLAAGIFVAGTIVLFGLFNNSTIIFPALYFLLCLALLSLALMMSREMFTDKSDLLFSFWIGILVCASAALSATSIRAYVQSSTENPGQQISLDLDTISKTNDYYQQYMTYLQKQIQSYQERSTSLQAQINQKIKEINTTQVVQVIQPAQIVQQPIVRPPRIERERESEEDD